MPDMEAVGKEMPEVSMDALREELSELVNRASFADERFIITRHGKQIAGLVGMKDLKQLVELDAA